MNDIKHPGSTKIFAAELVKEREYWLNKLSGTPVKACFPYDFPPNADRQYERASLDFAIPAKAGSQVIDLSRGADVKIYIVLVTGLVILLHKYTGKSDITLGLPIYRQEAEGDFLNTVLVLRNRCEGEITFKELLLQIGRDLSEAVEHQNYPLDRILHHLNIPAAPDEFPLFDAAVLLENIQDERYIAHVNYNVLFSFCRVDGSLTGKMDYNASLYRRATIDRITAHFNALLDQVMADINRDIADLEVLSGEEKNQILSRLNHHDAVGCPAEKTIHRLFEEQVEKHPNQAATVFENKRLKYRELDKRANRLAGLLRKRGVKPNSIVGFMADPSLETVIGILGILKAGGAYLPLEPEYPESRLDYMLSDSGADILVTTGDRVDTLAFGGTIIDSWDTAAGDTSPSPPPAAPSDLAYIIYTSGTTGRPKGVMVEHRHVVRLLFNDKFQFDFNGRDVWTMFHSFCFDFSVWEMFGALLYGATLIVIPKMTARDPLEFLKVLSREKVTVLNQTPSAFYNLLGDELLNQGYHLNIRTIIFGGESLKPHKLRLWRDKYPDTRLINMFGITETTVHVTFKEITDGEIESNVNIIGKPIPTLSTYVMDSNLRLQPIGVPGELCVGGAGLSRGYLQRPELTARKFVGNPFLKGDKIYRSGDLVRLLEDGNLEYLGRIDSQIQLRGYRIELGEIENCLLRHREIKNAAVIQGENANGDRFLCAYLVSDSRLAAFDLRNFLGRELPDYMIPAFFVQLEKMPLTPNGKIDTNSLPPPEVKAGDEYVSPRTDIERKLVKIWAEVLRIDAEAIGIDRDFFELGGDSLNSIHLIARIHKELNVRLKLPELFQQPTIRELARLMAGVEGPQRDEYSPIKAVEKKDYYVLSSAQYRTYFLQQIITDETYNYSIIRIIPLTGSLDKNHLEATFKKLINRHEAFRTSFAILNGVPVQRIHHEVEFNMGYHELAPGSGDKSERERAVRNFIKPFDLSRAPLMRAGLVKIAEGEYIVVVDTHHLISDAVSMDVISRDFLAFYTGEELPGLVIQYKDYAEWQARMKEGESAENQEEYWLNVFDGEVPRVDLPIDFDRPKVMSFIGDTLDFEINRKQTGKLRALLARSQVTANIFLHSLYSILLSKYTGQEDIIIGTPVVGRSQADLEDIVGMFSNLLALRTRPTEGKIFKTFLQEVKEHLLNAYENQDYQFEELVDKLAIPLDPSRQPLVDTVINFFDAVGEVEDFDTLMNDSPLKFDNDIAHYDLVFNIIETSDKISLQFVYSTVLFKAATIEKFARHYIEILEQVLESDEIRLRDIKLSFDKALATLNILKEDQHDFVF
jgi:amino acid adenylation domain-containing protein